MKKSTVIILTFLSCLLAAAILKMPKEEKITTEHTCSDITHQTCDGHCECDGLGCFLNNRFAQDREPLEYGLILNRDYTVTVIDLETDEITVSIIDSLGHHMLKLQE